MQPGPPSERPVLRGLTLARNSLWNLIGQGAPLLVAVFALPILIHHLGADRFGILTLGWAVVGYFGLFDLGLGRAVTKLVAQELGAQRPERVPDLARAALLAMLALGALAGALMALLAPSLARHVFRIPPELQGETITVFRVLAVATPFVVTTSGLRGLLEAHQRFGLVNAIRLPVGIFTFAAPLAVLPFTSSLPVLVGVLAVGRVIAWSAHLVLCKLVVPSLLSSMSLRGANLRELLRFGSWMAVSNFVGPLLLYVDRFLIAAVLSTAAVAYYTTPHQVLIRCLIVPSSIVAVMFPAFSQSFASDPGRARLLFGRALKIVALVMVPMGILLALAARPLLTIWIDPEFAERSAFVAEVLALGVAINSLGLVAQSFVQAAGRPDLSAKLHMVELPLYVGYLWFFLGQRGIDGAAIAWTLRVSLSTLALLAFARYICPGPASSDEVP